MKVHLVHFAQIVLYNVDFPLRFENKALVRVMVFKIIFDNLETSIPFPIAFLCFLLFFQFTFILAICTLRISSSILIALFVVVVFCIVVDSGFIIFLLLFALTCIIKRVLVSFYFSKNNKVEEMYIDSILFLILA